MNILVSGGSKTSNIVNGVQKKLESGGVNFIIKEDIDDIQDIFYTGGEFDKALISVESWTDDLTITDEYKYTRKLAKFVEAMERYSSGDETFVFLTGDEKYAEVVSEQILPLASRSIIVLKEKPYSVSFMKSLMLCALESFPKELIYNPTLEVSEIQSENGIEVEELETESVLELDETENLDEITSEFEEQFSSSSHDSIASDEFNVFDTEEIDENNSSIEFETLEQVESTDTLEFNGREVESTEFDFAYTEDTKEEQEETEIETANYREDSNIEEVAHIEIIEDIEESDKTAESENIENSFDDTMYSIEKHEDIVEEIIEEKEIAPVKKQRKRRGLFSRHRKKEKAINQVEPAQEVQKNEEEVLRVSQNTSISNETTKLLDVFARRGNSIAVTGCGGTGNSLIAYNIANTLCNLGYNVLLVDFDTRNRTQSYISKDAIECTDNENSSLMQSLRTSQGINAYINILRQGFHTLTMGPAGDIVSLEKMLEDKTLSRFINLAKVNHHFVVYDIPFDNAVGIADEVIYTCDNLVITVETNNHGVMKALLNICNIDKEELADTIFKKGQLLYNKYDGMRTLFGKRVKKTEDIASIMDDKVMEFIGVDPGNYFSDMEVCGFMQYDSNIENCWFGKTQYSDTDTGRDIFIELIKNILLK